MQWTKSARYQSKLKLYRKQSGLCWLCSEHLDLFQPTHTAGSASYEHVIPSCCGGSDRMSNMALTHHECNKLRGDRFIFKVERPRARPYAMPTAKYLQVGFDIAMRRLRKIVASVDTPPAAT